MKLKKISIEDVENFEEYLVKAIVHCGMEECCPPNKTETNFMVGSYHDGEFFHDSYFKVKVLEIYQIEEN